MISFILSVFLDPVELAKQHAKKMTDLESAKKMSLKERADAFTSAFQNDLDYYRTHGHPGSEYASSSCAIIVIFLQIGNENFTQ